MKCRFIYSFDGGGVSDSVRQTLEVSEIPRVGDSVVFVNEEGESAGGQVQRVVHYLDRSNRTHEVDILYGPS